MTSRCNPPRAHQSLGLLGGALSPCWLVTPRRCTRFDVCAVGPVAAAVRAVHPVHPLSMGGGRRKPLILLEKVVSVHPSTPEALALIRAHTQTRAGACLRARTGTTYLHTYGRVGPVDGINIHAGLRRPPPVHPRPASVGF